MRFDYRRDIHRQYMIISPGSEVTGESYQLKMAVNNAIPGFAACTYESMNAEPMLYYDVTGLLPLRVYFNAKKSDKMFIRRFIAAFLSGLETMEKYLIDPEFIVLQPDTVFVNSKNGEIVFVCFPFEGQSISEQLKTLAGFLLSVSSENAEDIKAAYRLYTVCFSDNVTVGELMDVLRTMREEEPGEKKIIGPEPACFTEPPAVYKEKEKKKDKEKKGGKGNSIIKRIAESVKGKQKENKRPSREPARSEAGEAFSSWREYRKPVIEENYHDETLEKENGNPYEETMFLSRYEGDSSKEITAWLVPADVFSGESIGLNKNEYVIGRGISPGIINIGVKAVSRKHARLVKRGRTYTVSDMGSRNGTFLNGETLAPGETKELTDGDVLRFADVEYNYRLA